MTCLMQNLFNSIIFHIVNWRVILHNAPAEHPSMTTCTHKFRLFMYCLEKFTTWYCTSMSKSFPRHLRYVIFWCCQVPVTNITNIFHLTMPKSVLRSQCSRHNIFTKVIVCTVKKLYCVSVIFVVTKCADKRLH